MIVDPLSPSSGLQEGLVEAEDGASYRPSFEMKRYLGTSIIKVCNGDRIESFREGCHAYWLEEMTDRLDIVHDRRSAWRSGSGRRPP